MFNGLPGFDNLSRMKEQYQTIHEQNSSFRQSLLVSPHCSKYQRQSSPKNQNKFQDNNSGYDSSLLDYIRPFQSQQLSKTQTKSKMRKNPNQNDNRKKTQTDSEDKMLNTHSKNNNLQNSIKQLKVTLRQKDQRITYLQKYLSKIMKSGKMPQTEPTVTGSPCISKQTHEHNNSMPQKTQKEANPFYKRQNRNLEKNPLQNQTSSRLQLQLQLQSYKKQLRFLTQNNNQLFHQLHLVSSHCQKIKQTLNITILYNKQLQEKIRELSDKNQQLEEFNQRLIMQKEEMMANYEEEVKLFRRMRRIWKERNGREREEIKNNKLIERAQTKSIQVQKSKEKQPLKHISINKLRRAQSAKLRQNNKQQ